MMTPLVSYVLSSPAPFTAAIRAMYMCPTVRLIPVCVCICMSLAFRSTHSFKASTSKNMFVKHYTLKLYAFQNNAVHTKISQLQS